MSAGETEEEALENIREARRVADPFGIALYLEPDPIELKSRAVLREVWVG